MHLPYYSFCMVTIRLHTVISLTVEYTSTQRSPSCCRSINIKTTAYKTLVRPLLEYSSSVWDPHTQTLINKIEMVQRRAARFCLNDYTSREAGCVSEMLNQLQIHQLKTRRTNRRFTILHKAIYGHLSITSSSPYNAYQYI